MSSSRNTIARTEILNLIREAGEALSHADLQESLGDLCNRVTIYRVLDRLLEERLIHKIADVDGNITYAACHNCSGRHLHNHIHFRCEECQSVTCLNQVEPEFKLPRQYVVHSMNFTVSGLCPKCSGKR
ncbi:zinc uptake transcriptional repressor [compost metagenome]